MSDPREIEPRSSHDAGPRDDDRRRYSPTPGVSPEFEARLRLLSEYTAFVGQMVVGIFGLFHILALIKFVKISRSRWQPFTPNLRRPISSGIRFLASASHPITVVLLIVPPAVFLYSNAFTLILPYLLNDLLGLGPTAAGSSSIFTTFFFLTMIALPFITYLHGHPIFCDVDGILRIALTASANFIERFERRFADKHEQRNTELPAPDDDGRYR